MKPTQPTPDQPTPAKQTRDVIAAVASRLNRTPAQPLNQTDLRIHIGEVVYQEHRSSHPDEVIPPVRAALPTLDAGVTCGEYAAQLRNAAVNA